MYESVKKILEEGGKCLLIENGKPLGVILTAKEYERLKEKKEAPIQKPEPPAVLELPIAKEAAAKSLSDEILKDLKELDIPGEMSETDTSFSDNLTLEDIGLDELPY